mmetsp:Transcript_178/g.405  ORF Transcript_178/g.405 Transcript_178/m.405 type:complete len:262 (-) Transcript_178:236-1021(-)
MLHTVAPSMRPVPHASAIWPNLGTPNQLQSMWAAMGGSTLPLLRNSRVAYQPKTLVYAYCTPTVAAARARGMAWCVARSCRWCRCAVPKKVGVMKTVAVVLKPAMRSRGAMQARNTHSSLTGATTRLRHSHRWSSAKGCLMHASTACTSACDAADISCCSQALGPSTSSSHSVVSLCTRGHAKRVMVRAAGAAMAARPGHRSPRTLTKDGVMPEALPCMRSMTWTGSHDVVHAKATPVSRFLMVSGSSLGRLVRLAYSTPT